MEGEDGMKKVAPKIQRVFMKRGINSAEVFLKSLKPGTVFEFLEVIEDFEYKNTVKVVHPVLQIEITKEIINKGEAFRRLKVTGGHGICRTPLYWIYTHRKWINRGIAILEGGVKGDRSIDRVHCEQARGSRDLPEVQQEAQEPCSEAGWDR